MLFDLLHILFTAGNWQEVLREHINPKQLPVVYGGTLTDPDGDPCCRTMVREQHVLVDQNPVIGSLFGKKTKMTLLHFPLLQIKYGGVVPKSYYVQDAVKVEYDSSVTISRGSCFQLEYDIKAPSSLLR